MTPLGYIINIVEVAITCFFIFNYFKMNDRFNRIYGIVTYFLLLTILTGFNLLEDFSDIGTLVFTLGIILFSVIFAENPLVEKIFVSVFLMLLNLLTAMMALVIIPLIFNLDFSYHLDPMYFNMVLILSKVLYFAVAFAVVRLRNNVDFDISSREWTIFIIISLVTIVTEINLVNILINKEYTNTGIVILVFLVLLNIVLMYLVFVRIQMFTAKRNQEQIELLNLKSQTKLNEQIEKNNAEVRKLKHDLKHELSILRGYLNNDNIDKAMESLNEYDQQNELITSSLYTGNYVIDYLISEKIDQAEKKSIRFYALVEKFEMTFDINEFGILLSNLLDNAIEHSNAENGEIILELKEKNEFIIMNIKNKIDESVLSHNKNLVSTRGKGHGHGLKSVRNIVNKHKGTIKFAEEDKMFIVSVVLKNQVS